MAKRAIEQGPRPKWRDTVSLGMVLVLVVFPLFRSSVMSLGINGPLLPNFSTQVTIGYVAWGVFASFIAFWAMFVSGDKFVSFGVVTWEWKRDLGMGFGFGVGYFVVSILMSVLITAHAEKGSLPSSQVPESFFPLLLISVTLSALSEETTMRAVVQTRVTAITGVRWSGALISVILFTSYHVYQGFSALWVIALFGVMASYLMERFKSLWMLTVMHATSNILILGSVVLFGFHRSR